ncbi:MAG: hypothetical protein EAZ42_00260 [Verrucomicrobia bacterium]|nr:MAG: hypothetical protein EAZ42_00260 [Verrucomicrobiota bacterium]
MNKPENESWQHSLLLARAILRDRKTRRRWLAGIIAVPVLMLVLGNYLIDGWLAQSAWRFFLWWSACFLGVVIAMCMALYDALAVIREERNKKNSDS